MEEMVYTKIHRSGGEVLLAVCDKEIVGEKLGDKDLVLEVKESFYKGDLIGIDEAIGLMENATIVNMVGNRIVAAAVDAGIITEKNTMEISGVKHAQIAFMI